MSLDVIHSRSSCCLSMLSMTEFLTCLHWTTTAVSKEVALDDCTPYAVADIRKIWRIALHLLSNRNGSHSCRQSTLRGEISCNYDYGAPKRASRDILGSFMLSCKADSGIPISAVQLIYRRLSSWVGLQNLIFKCTISFVVSSSPTVDMLLKDQFNLIFYHHLLCLTSLSSFIPISISFVSSVLELLCYFYWTCVFSLNLLKQSTKYPNSFPFLIHSLAL